MLRLHPGLLLLLPLLPACGPETVVREVAPSPFLSGFEPTTAREAAKAAFEETVAHWSRSGISVDPPGHHFAHWSVTGTLSDADLAALVSRLKDEMEDAMSEAGLSWQGSWSDAAGRAPSIVSQILGPGHRDVEGHFTRYEHGAGEGWVEVLVARGEAGTVTVGCGMHEPTHQ